MTINLTVGQLRQVLASVTPFACKDDHLPVISAVWLEWDGKRLFAVATDRYTVGAYRMALPENDRAKWTFLLSTRDAKRLVESFNPWGRRGQDRTNAMNKVLTLAVEGDFLTVQDEDQDAGASTVIRCRRVLGEFPKIRSVFSIYLSDNAELPPGLPAGVCVNPSYLSRFCQRARRGWGGSTQLRLVFRGPIKPILVLTDDENFIGLLMPVRYSDGDDQAWFAPTKDWATELAAEPAKVPAQRKKAKASEPAA